MRAMSEERLRMVRHPCGIATERRAGLRLREKDHAQRLLGEVDEAEARLQGKEAEVTKVFPSVLIALDVAAAAVYAAHGDVRRFVYWLAAATLTATVTF